MALLTLLTDKELKFISSHLAWRLNDYKKHLKKHNAFNGPALDQFRALEKLIYTKLIPEAWHGPRPAYWTDPKLDLYIGE